MPKNWMEWLGVIGSTTTIIAFVMYRCEHIKRKHHDTLMLGWLSSVLTVLALSGLIVLVLVRPLE
jgi:magnesium-transporting ATPase (P-type)